MIPEQPSAIGRYRWFICALLFFATTINYVDRQILSLIKDILDREIGWTNTQFGMVNSVFQLAYAAGLLGFGWFVDRFGTKLGYSVSIVAWSVAAMAHGLVGSISGFSIARVCLGLGEGGNFPSAIKATALWFPRRERAFATSIFNSGANVGAIVAPAMVPYIASHWGWHACFIAAGIAGFVWLAVWIPCYDIPERSKRLSAPEREFIESDRDEQAADLAPKPSWISLLKYPQTWSFITAKALTDPIWWFFLIWLPAYFHETRGLDIKESWVHLVTIYAIITVLSIIGGWFTGFLTARGWTVTRARKTGMFFYALCALPILLVTQASDWGAVMLIALAGSAHQAWSANLYSTVSDMFPKQAVASVVGIGGMAGALLGASFPTISGWILDAAKAKGDITHGYTILFTVCAFAYLISFAIHHLLAPKFVRVNLR